MPRSLVRPLIAALTALLGLLLLAPSANAVMVTRADQPPSNCTTPTTAGTFTFTVRVTDSVGAFAERTFSITIT